MYTLNKSIKYKNKYYRAGSSIKIDKSDLDEFKRRNLINEASESILSDLNKKDRQVVKEIGKTDKKVQGIDYNGFTVTELKVMLDNKGIEYKSTDTKKNLVKLLEEG